MRTLLTTLTTVAVTVAVTVLGAGTAQAADATYRVSDSWKLTYVNGTPTVIPRMRDDVVEVTCRSDDHMQRYRVNNSELVGAAFPRVDGTGIQIQPEFTGKTETLRITVVCRRG